ncbi:MAG: DUF2147 domain-containing protein [Caulobacteraceae bacterium]|nr:DUF2147 domain-containing protein [Caulobacteraceae bacterium]
MIGVVLSLAMAGAPAGGGDGAFGLWRTPVDGGSVVRIEPCGAAVCGRIVSSPRLRAYPDQKDVRNRDQTLQGRALKDLLVLKVTPIGRNRWGDGWVYNPEEGSTYRGVMELTANGELLLKGCVVAPFCRTQTWTRLADAPVFTQTSGKGRQP